MNNQVVAIVGPTAVGKTALGIELAKVLGGEIINGDASQVYKEMNIGTAKVTKEEMEGIPHHLLDFVPLSESYTVAEFQKDARRKIEEIKNRGKLPIFVGGTGLYIKAALYDYRFTDVAGDPHLREELEKFAAQEGLVALHKKLLELDRKAGEEIHPNNVKRVIRAIEKASLKEDDNKKDAEPPSSLYRSAIVGLTMDREDLYKRINKRVDKMIGEGLIEEAKSLYDRGLAGSTALQSIGYKELFLYFDGEITLDDAVSLIKRNTRRFAKRQMTWFRHQMDVSWFDVENLSLNFSKIINFIAGKFDEKSNKRV